MRYDTSTLAITVVTQSLADTEMAMSVIPPADVSPDSESSQAPSLNCHLATADGKSFHTSLV